MSKFKKEEEKTKSSKFPMWSNQDLRAFEKELEAYRIHKKLSTGEPITYIDFDKYLKVQGALNEHGAVRVFKYYGDTEFCLWEILQDKLQQLDMLRIKTKYAKSMELKGLEEIANTMNL